MSKIRKDIMLCAITALAGILLSGIVISYLGGQGNQENAQCISCHQEIGNPSLVQHPLVVMKECLACHVSYEVENHMERNPPHIDVCVDCHGTDELGRSHPVGHGIRDPNTFEELTCVSSCHRVHGTEYKYFIPYANNMDLCLSCHTDF